MPSGPGERYDFFLSRRGSVAAIAREVADVLTEKGYRVLVQDYDIPLGASFVDAMHEAVKNSRDLVILFTRDYEQSPYTRKEFTSFEAERAQSLEERHIIVLRCEDVPLRGLLADNVYQDLVSTRDPEERKRRIIAAAERQSQAVPPPPRPFIGVPPRIASFTGRADELDRLDAILMQDKPAAVTQAVGRAAVQGMGGVGKTSLAIEYAHRFRGLYAGVCWCPAETRTGLLSALAILAGTLGAATAEEADVEKGARAGLRRLAEQRATWLLVYDNVASPDYIVDLLPSAGARVLITSRFSDWSELADEVALDVLPIAEAVALLESRTGRRDATGAKTLSEVLGRLPLALDHAAAYCKRTQTQFGDYAQKASDLIDAAPRGAGYPRSVAATFNLAIAEAVAQCRAAEMLMVYLAHCAPERIPMILVEGGIDDEGERMRALAVLTEVSLLRHDQFEDTTPAVVLHRLVQTVTRIQSQTTGTAQYAIRRLIARLVAVYPFDFENPRLWPLCGQLTPHVSARGYAYHDDGSLPGLLDRAGRYLHERAAYSQAAPLFNDALALRQKTLGPEHPDTATSLSNLALLRKSQGDLAAARPLYERALAIHEKILGPEHADSAASLDNLAVLLQDQGDLAGAQPPLERALAIREKTLGAEHPDTAMSLSNLALLLTDQGDRASARPLFERALAIVEKTLGPWHPKTATSLIKLALLDDAETARPLIERALLIREKALGSEHPDTAASLMRLAYLLHTQGDLAGARSLLERALAINEKALGLEHPATALCLTFLSDVLRDQGNFDGARLLLERALVIGEKLFGRDESLMQRYAGPYALMLLNAGRANKALAVSQSALATQEGASDGKHPWIKFTADVTARALDELGRTEDAKALRERYKLTDLRNQTSPTWRPI